MSFEFKINSTLSDEEKYIELQKIIPSLINEKENLISNLSNFTAILKEYFAKISWVGFYLFDGKKLYLGPFQGKVACTEIELGRGVCGTAALKKETIIVDDVHKFEGHIACDSGSNSEIVVPIFNGEKFFGTLDLDSYNFSAFDEKDKFYLEDLVKFLAEKIFI